MGNAIKFLKWKISNVPPDMPESEAKEELRRGIQKFLKERIHTASDAVAIYGTELISDGEVIIVYGL